MKRFINIIKNNKILTSIAILLLLAVITSGIMNGIVASYKPLSSTVQDFNVLDTLPDGSNQKVKVILLNGQSNASGVGSVSYLQQKSNNEDFIRYEAGYDNVLINFFSENGNYSSQSKFVKAKIGQGCTPDYIGPELGLADRLSSTYNDELVFILKYSWCGSNLHTQWRSPSSDGDTGELYTAFINFTKTSMDYLLSKNYDASISAMSWMQGESDAFPPDSQAYKQNLTNFISDTRNDLTGYYENSFYFIDAGISDSPAWTDYLIINQAKSEVAALSEKNRYIDTILEGLEYDKEPVGQPDIAHFDALSTLKLGHLFADEIIFALSE